MDRPSPRLMSTPRLEGWPLASIGTLLLASLILAGWGAHEKRQRMAQADQVAAASAVSTANKMVSRQLLFRDAADSSIVVRDAQTGQNLPSIEGEAGFARSVLRSLARARMRAGHGPDQPFTLTRTDQGGLILSDALTGERIDLAALGPTNAGVFAIYLK
jgi:putative photosynthetic complex assembly protein